MTPLERQDILSARAAVFDTESERINDFFVDKVYTILVCNLTTQRLLGHGDDRPKQILLVVEEKKEGFARSWRIADKLDE